MDDWVLLKTVWSGFNELPKDAKSTFEDRIEGTLKSKGKRTLNVLLMGKSCVGKSSTMENIVKMGKFASTEKLQKNELIAQVFSFQRGDFTLNFIDTEPFIDVGTFHDDLLLLLTDLEEESREFVDVILYVDRADVYSMNATDLIVAKAITEIFGENAWSRVLIVLTHCDALEESREKDFRERRKAELLDWIAKGGDIKEDVKDTLEGRVVFIDNAMKYNDLESVEKIHDDDDLPITTLINKIADIVRDSKEKSSLAMNRISQDGYEEFSERIFEDCKTKYFQIISNVDNPKGEQQEWNSFNLDDISELFLTLKPEKWKTDHLPQRALQSIQNLKSNVKLMRNASFTVLIMGRGGVGKSSIANSIIGADVFPVNKTKGSQEILLWSGSISNFTLRIIEIPEFIHYGNVHPKYFEAIKRFWRKYKINALLFVERLDEWKRDSLMRKTLSNIANFCGPQILNRALIVLTHCGSSSREQFESRSNFIKEIMSMESSNIHMRREFKVDAIKAVAVDNCVKYHAGNKAFPPDKSEWMAELFEGLFEISERVSGRDAELECDDLERRDWKYWDIRKFYGYWRDRDYTEELEKNLQVVISFHERNRRRHVDHHQEDIPFPKRYKRCPEG